MLSINRRGRGLESGKAISRLTWLKQWLAFAAFFLPLALSLAIAAWPEQSARPVVPTSGLLIGGGFERSDPPHDYEARLSILQSPELAIWRTWNGSQGSVPGDARSSPFHMPRYLAVPYQGFAGERGVRIYLECMTSRRTMDVAIARTNNQWSETLVSRPRSWCSGDTRLRIHSDSSQYFIAFGTPYRISWISWIKTRPLGLAGLFLVFFMTVAGACVAASRMLLRIWPSGDVLALGFIGIGSIGYALFFAFYASRTLGWLLSLLLLAWALSGFASILRAPSLKASLDNATSGILNWREPALAWLVVAAVYLLILFDADNGAGAWMPNARFAPVRWSTDNQLPMLIGEHLARLKVSDLDLAPWLVSDRTPLSYGLHAWLRVIGALLTPGNDGPHLARYMHTVAGVIINTAWVPVMLHMLRSLQLSLRSRSLAVLTAVLLPFCLFNSVYIWPKLLGGTFGLLAMWVLLIRKPSSIDGQESRRPWVQAASLSALAMLSHGGTVFGIAAMLVVAFATLPFPRPSLLLRCGLVAICFLAPWMAWQRLVQPPGNALLKLAFAGNPGFGDTSVGLIRTIRRSYASLTPGRWLDMKLDALSSLALPPSRHTCGAGEMLPAATRLGEWRIVDFLSFAPSLKFLWLGLAVLVVLAARRQIRAEHRPALLLLGTGLLGILVCATVTWDCQIIHTQSYQSILAVIMGLLILLLQAGNRSFGLVAVSTSIAYGLAVWILDPLVTARSIDGYAWVGVCLLAAWATYCFLVAGRIAGNRGSDGS